MKTYLCTWNPQKWDWKEIDEEVALLKNEGILKGRWSCGNNKSIKINDRIFVLRLGIEPKGIIASGYATTDSYLGQHWDGTNGKKTNYVDIDFDILINPLSDKIIELEYLKTHFSEQEWTPQVSGISIKENIVEKLEEEWLNHVNENKLISSQYFGFEYIDKRESEDFKLFEGKSKQVLQNKYERNPFARKKCIEHYGYNCSVCGINFESKYGEIGKNFIHIHHITPISEIKSLTEVNPIEDLRPVCPNCHAMIHRNNPILTIIELRDMINK